MKAVFLTKYGNSSDVFEIRETAIPEPKGTEVLVKVETFGLNFADVIARRGMYGEAPANPCILGYEVVGHIEKLGPEVTTLKVGQKVVGLTRFGGYAEYALTEEMAAVVIPEEMDNGVATCLATQYATAYYSAYILGNLQENDHVLIHAAAGGVGIALTQLAKLRGCVTYGTTSSAEKIAFIKKSGIDFPINYKDHLFEEEVLKLNNSRKLDVIFDPIGGKNFKKSKSVLANGGRIITYGASDQLKGKKGFLNNMRLLFGFGFLHPVFLIMSSKSVLGVNLLRIAENRPDLLNKSMNAVVNLVKEKKLSPHVGASYHINDIAIAHDLLESRKSIGKVVVNWSI
ncbi:MAG: zinc-binding dehydrogenase [Bacteroidetes bacterium]|nr:zinc-binding dehydrogenase [Bacteroidota bacterium]MBT7993562.1 zinc-binding dehydrogenase [Bacteroidota bacterium]